MSKMWKFFFKIMYLVFLGLASWQIDKIHRNVQEPTYQDTTPVGIATIDINSNSKKKFWFQKFLLKFYENLTKFFSARVVIDPYFDSLGWYTEEIKYRWEGKKKIFLIFAKFSLIFFLFLKTDTRYFGSTSWFFVSSLLAQFCFWLPFAQ